MREVLAVGLITLLLGACGSGDDSASTVGSSSEPETSTTAGDFAEAACAAMEAYTVAYSEIDGDDLDSLRSGSGNLVTATDDLRSAAPDEIADAAGDLHAWAVETEEHVSDPGFALDPDTLYMWDTAASAGAQEAIGAWTQEHCGDLTTGVRPDLMLVLCLGADADDAVFEAVNPRLQIPTGEGDEVELPAGVQGVSWDYAHGEIDVTLDRFITPQIRADLEATLREPPVLDAVEVDVPWGSGVHADEGPTVGCT